MHNETSAVVTACAASTCPWPKQLFLQNDIILTSTKSSNWNMNQHPFDTQVLAYPCPYPYSYPYPYQCP